MVVVKHIQEPLVNRSWSAELSTPQASRAIHIEVVLGGEDEQLLEVPGSEGEEGFLVLGFL